MKMNRWMGLLVTFFLILSLLSLYSLLILKYDYMSIGVPAFSIPSVGDFPGWEGLRQDRAVTARALGVLLNFFIFDERGRQITVMVFCANLLGLLYMIHYLYASGRIRRLTDLTAGGDEVLLTEDVVKGHILRTISSIEAVYEARMNLKIYRGGIVIENRLKLLEGSSVPEVLHEIRETITRELRDNLGIVAPIQVASRVVSLVKISRRGEAPSVPSPSPAPSGQKTREIEEVSGEKEEDHA